MPQVQIEKLQKLAKAEDGAQDTSVKRLKNWSWINTLEKHGGGKKQSAWTIQSENTNQWAYIMLLYMMAFMDVIFCFASLNNLSADLISKCKTY